MRIQVLSTGKNKKCIVLVKKYVICTECLFLDLESKESIPPAYVAWRAGTTTLFLLGSSIDCSKIPAHATGEAAQGFR